MKSYAFFLEENAHEFSTTQVNLPEFIADRIRLAAMDIPVSDLAEHGYEDHPHITIKYGLHTSDATDAQRVLKGTPLITATLGTLSLFELPDADVLKLDVESADLQRVFKRLMTLPNTETYSKYQPHVTVAYLKPGLGARHTNNPELNALAGLSFVFDSIEFSDQIDNKTQISLA